MYRGSSVDYSAIYKLFTCMFTKLSCHFLPSLLPSLFFLSYLFTFYPLLLEYTHSIFRPEVVGGDQTWL